MLGKGQVSTWWQLDGGLRADGQREHVIDADGLQDRHARHVQDVVLVALALPVLHVHVRQLDHWRLGHQQPFAPAVDGDERDHIQRGQALRVDGP